LLTFRARSLTGGADTGRIAAAGAAATAVLFIDLDKFKQANDTYGHEAGDHVLRVVAGRLSDTVRAGETVARLGGDEFVVVAERVAAPEDVKRLASRLAVAIAQPVVWGPSQLCVGASIGVALARGHET
jgi:diguanylate cyclase (GGDEF)-like protein